MLAKQPRFVPVLGARTPEQLGDALDHLLSAANLARLETLVPQDAIAGARYDSSQMARLDSER